MMNIQTDGFVYTDIYRNNLFRICGDDKVADALKSWESNLFWDKYHHYNNYYADMHQTIFTVDGLTTFRNGFVSVVVLHSLLPLQLHINNNKRSITNNKKLIGLLSQTNKD